jgi:hypothetical protein
MTNSSNNTILDVGAGAGTYAKMLASDFPNIDAVEVFEPYVRQYNLRSLYRNVYVENIMKSDIELHKYNMIILGDVFEHLSEEDALRLLEKLLSTQAEFIIAVPFNAPQGAVNENVHEIHLQEKLTFASVLKKYKQLIPLCVRYDYGVFIRSNLANEYVPLFYKDLDEEFVQKLKLMYPYKALINVDEPPQITSAEEIFIEEQNNVTIVTGLWDIGRGNIGEGFKRSYDHYKQKFAELLKAPNNMIIYVSAEDEEFVWKHRSRSNTFVKIMELDEFKNWFEFYNKVQEIRIKPEWREQAGWLADSPQANLPDYNPIVMSKMFLLNNASIYNPFDTEYFYWIDAGITNTVHPGYFSYDKVFNKLSTYSDAVDTFTFISYPYTDNNEIHGFPRSEMNKYCNTKKVDYVCRGGFFGGKKEHINKLNALYYGLLQTTLDKGLMGTEESIFTILTYRHPELTSRFEIESNGLVWPFFEKLKDVQTMIAELPEKPITSKTAKVNLYVLGFNSPQQFQSIVESIQSADNDMFTRTRKILINNSTDQTLFAEYDSLCEKYGFEEIHRENLGVCGGRQYAAEHFEESNADFYMFFEDDMHINGIDFIGQHCKSGFIRYIPNLYNTSLKIMIQDKFDFLKLSFSEFYGDNSVQWAWYNVPQTVRSNVWPHYDTLPEVGIDPNSPKTQFNNILMMDNTAYITGEIYYSNWPQIVSRSGNKKMFLDTKWSRPYEQTWMSHCFQMSREGKLSAAVLLASPVEHKRFEFYDGNLRKES